MSDIGDDRCSLSDFPFFPFLHFLFFLCFSLFPFFHCVFPFFFCPVFFLFSPVFIIFPFFLEEIPRLFEHSHQFFAQSQDPFARQVHERERCASLGRKWLHDPHSEQQDVNIRIWINPVISEIVFQPLHMDTDTSKNSINGVVIAVFNMTLSDIAF